MYICCIYVRTRCICTYICMRNTGCTWARLNPTDYVPVCCLFNLPFAFQTSGGQQAQNDWEALQVNDLLKAAMKRKLLTYISTHSCPTEIKPTSPRARRPIRGSRHRSIRLDFYFLNRSSCSTFSLLRPICSNTAETRRRRLFYQTISVVQPFASTRQTDRAGPMYITTYHPPLAWCF